MDIPSKIREIIAENTDVRHDQLTDSAQLTSLEIDSLDMVTIIYEVEEIFDVEIETDDVQGLGTLGNLISKLTELIKSETK